MPETLEDVMRDARQWLEQAVRDRRSPMHTPVVATAHGDARVMVLRDIDGWCLRFHTDVRAPKVAAIEADGRIGVLFYDKAQNVQIRVRGTGRIERTGDAANAAWSESANFARRCYLGKGPGTATQDASSGLPPEFEGVEPTDTELLPARENFAILLVELHSLDWFTLSHEGHRRAMFELPSGAGRWVTP